MLAEPMTDPDGEAARVWWHSWEAVALVAAGTAAPHGPARSRCPPADLVAGPAARPVPGGRRPGAGVPGPPAWAGGGRPGPRGDVRPGGPPGGGGRDPDPAPARVDGHRRPQLVPAVRGHVGAAHGDRPRSPGARPGHPESPAVHDRG